MHEELKIEKVTLMSKVEECIVQLIKEIEAAIVQQKQEILKKNNNDHERQCAQIDNYTQLLVLHNGWRRESPSDP